ncbi:hypothetical protein K1T71_003145 [Dendrolimus kikuchii]|uniref:Uncharacterized protein n=1 Tax=Dendrolimus kikuchii TaxID=765133 RepID=A0ACC1DB42_9NEOP|nr:hypothetical protein K1T71_003145 [Dendrolimus kikuchii]
MARGVNTVKLIFQLWTYDRSAILANKSVKIKKAEIAKQSEMAKKLKVAKGYWTLEMAPPGADEMQRLQSDLALAKEFMKTGCYKFLTVKQAWLLFLVVIEVALWFYLGETIGKMHVVGYKI